MASGMRMTPGFVALKESKRKSRAKLGEIKKRKRRRGGRDGIPKDSGSRRRDLRRCVVVAMDD
jgi:hypothetical protein